MQYLHKTTRKQKKYWIKQLQRFKAYPAAEIDFTLTMMENPSENIHEMHEGKPG